MQKTVFSHSSGHKVLSVDFVSKHQTTLLITLQTVLDSQKHSEENMNVVNVSSSYAYIIS